MLGDDVPIDKAACVVCCKACSNCFGADHTYSRIQTAEKFLSKLEILQRVLGNTSKQPIKVAILDTGIDLPDGMPKWMRKPRYKAYSWIGVPPDNDQCQYPPRNDENDPDGHGTHMASIVLDIARNCQLYVVQVAGARSEACGEKTNVAIAMNIARASRQH